MYLEDLGERVLIAPSSLLSSELPSCCVVE